MIKYRELFKFNFKLGVLGFGGPLALIGQAQEILVRKNQWVQDEEFTRVVSMIKTLPGPVAFQTMLYFSSQLSNRWIGTLCGIVFILPSFILMILLAKFYDQFKLNMEIATILSFMSAGTCFLIGKAWFDLSKAFVKKISYWGLLILSLILLVHLKVPEPMIILFSGVSAVLIHRIQTNKLRSMAAEIFWICFKAGAFSFGTGLTIIPLLEQDFVQNKQWITHQQFLDAITFGQLTPGPVVITVAFIGFKLLGFWGAVGATTGIFLPSWFNMLTWFPTLLKKMAQAKWIMDFVMGAMAALAAGIFVVVFQLLQEAELLKMFVAGGLFLITLKYKINSGLFILLCGAAGAVSVLKIFL